MKKSEPLNASVAYSSSFRVLARGSYLQGNVPIDRSDGAPPELRVPEANLTLYVSEKCEPSLIHDDDSDPPSHQKKNLGFKLRDVIDGGHH